MHVSSHALRCMTRAVDLYPVKIGVESEGSRYSYTCRGPGPTRLDHRPPRSNFRVGDDRSVTQKSQPVVAETFLLPQEADAPDQRWPVVR
jgi:hypothetical protein